VLDALLAEARLRWAARPGGGPCVVVPAERLVAIPIEPSRPALVVPQGSPAGRRPRQEAPSRSPARNGPAGFATPSPRVPLYPVDHPVGRFRRRRGDDRGRARGGPRIAAALPGPGSRRRVAAASPWACPWISNGARPDGCPWDREQTHESMRNHTPRGRPTMSTYALAGGATLEVDVGSWATSGSADRPPRHSCRWRPTSSTLADVQAASPPDRAPAPPTSSATRWFRTRPTSTASGSGSSRRSAPPRRRRRRRPGRPRPPRRVP